MSLPLNHARAGSRPGPRFFSWLLVPTIAAAIGFGVTLAVPRTALAPMPLLPPMPITVSPSGPAASAGVPMAISTGANVLPATLALTVQPGLLSVGGARIGGGLDLSNGTTYHFPDDFQPAGSVTDATPVADPILGPAQYMSAQYGSRDGSLTAVVDVTVANATPALIYQGRVTASSVGLSRFALPDGLVSELDLAGPIRYITLLSTGPLQGTMATGDAAKAIPLPDGTPLLIWSDTSQRGYILGLLDEARGPSTLTVSASKNDRIGIGVGTPPTVNAATISPRLYLERVDTSDLTRAFTGFRHALDVIAPAPPVPSNFRNQWGSWYVYGGGINEELVRNQIDAISSRYADVGPWQVEIDAGWSRAGGDPDGQMGVVDTDKFPSGMRSLVDYAHARGIGVALYGSAPWVDSRPSITDWWVVQLGFIRDHLDWLIKVQQDAEGASYVYDLTNPGFRTYLEGVIRRYLVDFNADGIELDMVGVIGPEGGPFRGQPSPPGGSALPPSTTQTMEVYREFWTTASRLKPGAWIETGYAAPPLARPYADSWKLADDYAAFSHPYPFAGLKEQVTYAILQRQLLGRNAHVGFVQGGPDSLDVQRQWLAAAVALQAQTALSVDLANATPDATRMYREYLAALHPFIGTSAYGPGVPPEAFATTVDGTTYLALMNSSAQEKTIAVNFTDFGLAPGQVALAFDPQTRVALPTAGQVSAIVAPQSLRLIVLRQTPGVLWADRGWTAQADTNTLTVSVKPGPFPDGRFWIYAPGARSVLVDGVPSGRWALNPDGFIILDLANGDGHRVDVTMAR